MQFVMNTITGAWCRFLNIDAQCWELFNDRLYFGSTDGKVYKWDVGSGDYSGDEDLGINARVQTAFNYFDTRGWKKRFTAIRPIINTDGSTVLPGVGLNVDFGTNGYVSSPASQISGQSCSLGHQRNGTVDMAGQQQPGCQLDDRGRHRAVRFHHNKRYNHRQRNGAGSPACSLTGGT